MVMLIVWTFCLLSGYVLLTAAESIAAASQYISEGPISQMVSLGSVVTLRCRVKISATAGTANNVHWVKDGFGLGTSRADVRQYGKPTSNSFRYDLPFNLAQGEYDLRITNLNLMDEGIFYCQIDVNGHSYSSRKAKLTVLVQSEAPVLKQKIKKGLEEQRSATQPLIVNNGNRLNIACLAKEGRPAASIQWYLNGQLLDHDTKSKKLKGVLKGKITYSVTASKKKEKLYDAKSRLVMQITNLRHGNWLKCVAVSKGYEKEKPKFVKAKIEVHTIPIVNIQAYPKRPDFQYTENDVVEFECFATGRPNSFVWKWYINSKLVKNIASSTYKLRITRKHHNAKLKCSATSTREGSTSIKLSVRYGPRFSNQNTVIYPASPGDNIKMDCKVDSNPKAKIYWQRETGQETIYRGPTYKRKDVQLEDFGMYRCTAEVPGFTSVFRNSVIAKKKKPVIKNPTLSYGRQGYSARLVCDIQAIPIPTSKQVKWLYKARAIKSNDRYKIYQKEYVGGVITTLQIMSIRSTDFGKYNCTVSTKMGYASAVINFIRKGDIPVIMVIGASVVLVFILLVIILVVCICRRRMAKDYYHKGNPSSPEIQMQRGSLTCSNSGKLNRHHQQPQQLQQQLIDSDCHCNPNIYGWNASNPDNDARLTKVTGPDSSTTLASDVGNKIMYQNGLIWPGNGNIYSQQLYSTSNHDQVSTYPSKHLMHSQNESELPNSYMGLDGGAIGIPITPGSAEPPSLIYSPSSALPTNNIAGSGGVGAIYPNTLLTAAAGDDNTIPAMILGDTYQPYHHHFQKAQEQHQLYQTLPTATTTTSIAATTQQITPLYLFQQQQQQKKMHQSDFYSGSTQGGSHHSLQYKRHAKMSAPSIYSKEEFSDGNKSQLSNDYASKI